MALPIRIKLYRSYRTLPSCQACISEIDKVQCKPKILYQSSLITISLTALSNFIDPPKVLLNFIKRMMSVAGLWQVFLRSGTKLSTFYYFLGIVPQTACLSTKSSRTTLFWQNHAPDHIMFVKISPNHTFLFGCMSFTSLSIKKIKRKRLSTVAVKKVYN